MAKVALVIEEADESGFWMERLVEVGIVKREVVRALQAEASGLVAIVTSSRKTVVARMEAERARRRSARR